METNVGNLDRAVRMLLGAVLIGVAFLGSGPIRWLAGVGLVLIATGLARFCPVYRLFGLTTCPSGGSGRS